LSRAWPELIEERVRPVNRIKGLLFSQGVGDYEPLRRNRRTRLNQLRTGDGRPLGEHLRAQILRELDRLELRLEQIRAVEREREALLADLASRENVRSEAAAPAAPVGLLTRLKGVGPEFAAVLWTEGLCRTFANRRQAGAYGGLAPTPWRSGAIAHEQGVSKTGNPPLAQDKASACLGSWLIHQPQSALARWYRQRLPGMSGKAARKRLIVALARKLFVALWKLTSAGVVIEGAAMKASA
jgi:transposase